MNDTNDDKSLFRKHFADIQRIDSNHVEHPKSRISPYPVHKPSKNWDIKTPISPYPELPPENKIDDYHFRKGGIQDKIFRQLKRGQLPIEDRIDLHGMTRERALDKLKRFIEQAQLHGIRCILVIHGKGTRSERGPVLRRNVPVWLRQMSGVLAYCPAQKHGGNGALYVLLRRYHGR